MIKLFINVVVSPLIIIVIVHFFTGNTWQAAVFATLIGFTIGNLLAFIGKTIKLFFQAVTFNFLGAIKQSMQIIYSLMVLAIYWVIYFYMWGFDFSANFWQTVN